MASNSLTNATVTEGSQRIGNWDGWRGIAIVLVLCGHFLNIEWLWEDRLGVDVFFVLSGMLMSIILFEKRLSLRDFYIRRLSRIYFSTLLFLRTYLPAEPDIWATDVAIGHLWSLNVEEHAYLFLSLISLILVRRKYIAWLLLALGVGSVLLSFYHYNIIPTEEIKLYLIRTESAVVFIFFSAGYGLLRRQFEWTLPPLVPVVCFAGAVACYALALPLWLVFAVSPILLAICVNHLDDLPKLVNKLLLFAPLRYIGLWSYSIYLWQQFFYIYAWKIPGGRPAGLLLALVFGISSYYLLETPVRRLINSKWSANPVYRSRQSDI